MNVVVTGSAGFLGWHTRLRLDATTDHAVVPVSRHNWADLPALMSKADAVIHLAGVNRGTPDKVSQGNLALARNLAAAVRASRRKIRVVYASTIQVDRPGPYGDSKRMAGDILAAVADEIGARYTAVILPNIFGAHCRPYYNAFSATFIEHVIKGTEPVIDDNRVQLLHAQDAAAGFIQALSAKEGKISLPGFDIGVREVWSMLKEFHTVYEPNGDLPDLSTKLRVDLFNAYRAALFPTHAPIKLDRHVDHRGAFVETVRNRGGGGQTSFSTTKPGLTRGNHYHLSKIERFVVIRGHATIELRRMFTDRIISFDVYDDCPVAIDMPIGWAHSITNIGDNLLLTQFWSHDIFRPDEPDTFREPVRPTRCES